MSFLKRSLRSTLCCLTLLILFTCTNLLQADVITIPDDDLRAAIEAELGKNPGDPITDAEMATMTIFVAISAGISDLSGLEYASNLEKLTLYDNEITDISPLSGITSLQDLDLGKNQIADISALSSLTSLQTLQLSYNEVTDISVLSSLVNIQYLLLPYNQITDISALSGMENLNTLYLFSNQVADISPLSGLTSLEFLFINNNLISDISPLSGMVNLHTLFLFYNQISDISPLIGIELTVLSIEYNYIDVSDGSSARTQVIDPLIADGATVIAEPQNEPIPEIEVSIDSIALVASPGDSVSTQFTVRNAGQDYQVVALVASDDSMLVDPIYRNLEPDNEMTVTLSIDPVPDFEESFTGSILILDDHLPDPIREIPVEISAPPTTITIPDANLRAAIEARLEKGTGDSITADEMAAITTLSVTDEEISDLTGIEYATNLVNLYISRNQIQDISQLAGLTNLERLELSYNLISEITPLSGLSNLLDLSISNNLVEDLSPLSNLTNLKTLALAQNPISNISPLADLSSLQLLSIEHTQVANISPLNGLTNLTYLSLRYNQIGDISSLNGLQNLLHLALDYNQVDDISPLLNLTNLQYLTLGTNPIGDISILSHLRSLEHLDLNHTQINDITHLSGLTNLQYLILHGNQISDLSDLSALTNLLSLRLERNNISDIEPLSNLSNLQFLYIGENPIESISPLRSLTGLVELWSNDNQISDLTDLSGLINLERLFLFKNSINDLSPIASLSNIQTLSLGENQIADLSSLSELENLQSLDLYDNSISDISPLSGMEFSMLNVRDNYIDISEGSAAHTLVIDPLLASGAEVFYSPQHSKFPTIESSHTALVLGGSPGDSTSFVFRINNSGLSDLSWSSTTETWITLDPESGIIEPSNEITIQASIESIPDYTDSLDGTITINSNDPSTPSLDVSVSIYPPVDIPDTNLLEAMNLALGTSSGSGVSKEQLATLTELHAMDMNISDLSGLEHAVNLTSLNLSNNQISDISPLAGLTNLTHLYLYNNKLTDITALAGLDQLEVLRIYGNYIDIADGAEARTGVIDPLTDAGAEVLYAPQLESEIEISPTSLVLIGNPGDSLSASINLENTGTNDLVWSSSSGDAWMITDPASGIIEPGNSQDVAITIDPVPDFSDVLSGIITLASNDADTPVIDIPVEVHSPIEMGDAALRSLIEEALGLDPGSPIIAPDLATLTYLDASNLGISDLTGLEYAVNLEYLNLQANLIDISEGSDARVLVIDPLIAGGTEVVFSPQLAPKLTIDPMKFVFAGESGDVLSTSISIENTGQLDLTWSVGETADWVTLEPASGILPPDGSASINLSIDSVPTFIDSLTGSIVLESNDPDTPSVTVTVEIYPHIEIPDPNLRSAIEEALGLNPGGPIIAPQLADLTTLDASGREIVDLSGIENAVNLLSLDLGNNFVTELDSLQALAQLDFLDVRMNLLDIRTGSTDREIIDQLDTYATVHFSPQRYPMRNFADFLTDHTIPEGQDGFLDTNGPLEIQNLMAFAMGIDPMTVTQEMLPQAIRDEEAGTYSFCFYRNLAAMDVELLIESSADMETWTPVSPGELNILSETETGQQYVEAAFRDEDQPIFYRVRAVPSGQ